MAAKRKVAKKNNRKTKGRWSGDTLTKKEMESLNKQMKEYEKKTGKRAWKGK